jgi:lipopolysaccharide transport system permease protein
LPGLHLQELWRYRDLILMFVRRDFVAIYKQTISGPGLFFCATPAHHSHLCCFFGLIAGIFTGALPMLVFYLAGITIWNCFAGKLNKTAIVF